MDSRHQYKYRKSINEGVIPFDSIKKIKCPSIPESLLPIVWRNVQDFLTGKNTKCFFLFLEDVNCSECGKMVRESLYLSELTGRYHVCKTCCGKIWNYIQDSIF